MEELRALRALDGAEIVLVGEPKPGALPWCAAIPGTPHWSCSVDVADLRIWIRDVVSYAAEIDCLRGVQDACDSGAAP